MNDQDHIVSIVKRYARTYLANMPDDIYLETVDQLITQSILEFESHGKYPDTLDLDRMLNNRKE